MIRQSASIHRVNDVLPTVWGLDPIELHDRFWASRGICVVRPGSKCELPRNAELFMLTDTRTLAVFRLRNLVDHIYWVRPAVLFIRLQVNHRHEYREVVRTDADGCFERVERHYPNTHARTARVVLTRDRRVAGLWQTSDGSDSTWREFRRQTRHVRRETMSLVGRWYDRCDQEELEQFITDLVQIWKKPAATINGLKQSQPGVWTDPEVAVKAGTHFVGPTWIGRGRAIPDTTTCVMGPAVLWDKPGLGAGAMMPAWNEIEPTEWTGSTQKKQPLSARRRISKRGFDILFAVVALLLTLPLYPFLMLAICIEDGRPFFFSHKRETVGGREFGCLKFRSMRKNADAIKHQLAVKNQSDGPQFFLENDPRVTRVGLFMRKFNLDELPQFINVLLGQMSVVGPRPSPRKENQCCPAWREARLSVRPGITGLWQISRTRSQGLDFQEWIRFDIDYVRNANWHLDLKIVLKTMRIIVGV